MSVKYADFGFEKQTAIIDDRIKFVHLKRPNSVFSIYITFKAGALYQPVDKPGLAHFVEHMLVKESKKYPTMAKIKNTLSQTAALSNAFTSPDKLSIMAIVPEIEDVQKILGMIVDQFNSPMMYDERIENERSAIQQEIRMKEKDFGQVNVRRLLCLMMNKEGDFIYPTTGSVEQVTKLKKQDLTDYYDTLRQQKIYITSTGRMDISELTNYFPNSLKTKELNELKLNLASKPQAKAVITSHVDKNHNVVIHLGRRINVDDYINIQAEIRLMLEYLIGQKGLLYDKLRHEKGLVYYIGSYNYLFTGFGTVGIQTECSKDKVSAVISVMNDELKKVKDGQIDLDMLAMLKSMITKRLKFIFEKSINVTESFIDSNIGDKFDPIEMVAAVQKVTASDVARVADEYFQIPDMLWSFTGDLEEKDLRSLGIEGKVLFV